MHGFTHRHRRATVALVAVLVLVLSGCTYGLSTLWGAAGGRAQCPFGADVGPGHLSTGTGGDIFIPAPTTVRLRFGVLNSDSPQPITATVTALFGGGSSEVSSTSGPTTPPATASFGVVWDGAGATGIREVGWGSQAFYLTFARPGVSNDIRQVSWWVMALDAAGREVGFSNCVSLPT